MLTFSFAYSRSSILINLNDERKIMVKNDYPCVLGGGEVNKTNLAILRQCFSDSKLSCWIKIVVLK